MDIKGLVAERLGRAMSNGRNREFWFLFAWLVGVFGKCKPPLSVYQIYKLSKGRL